MLKKVFVAATLALAATAPLACDGGGGGTAFTIPPKALDPGGVYVAYSNGCAEGCDQLGRADLIQEIDGKPVATGADFDAANLTDGQPHQLKVLKPSGETIEVTIVAEPNTSLAPIMDAPPLWTTGAAALNKAPKWARRRLFGHASPQIQMVNSDGGFVTGRDFYGKKQFIVYFDWSTRTDQANAATFMKVLQKAQADLNSKGIDVVFAQLQFPGRQRPPMNDSDIRGFANDADVSKDGEGTFPQVPLYRFPNSTEYNAAKALGMEGAYTVREALGQAPAIVLQDERGIVRWHSEGTSTDPEQKLPDDVYTIIQGVTFALEDL